MDLERLRLIFVALDCLKMANILNTSKKRSKRRWWVRPYLQRRREIREFEQLLPYIICLKDPEIFFRYTRMSIERYNYLLFLISPSLEKYSIRETVSPNERLTITLVFDNFTACMIKKINLFYLACIGTNVATFGCVCNTLCNIHSKQCSYMQFRVSYTLSNV